MRKFAPLFFVLFAFLFAAAGHGGEREAILRLREEARDPNSNVLRILNDNETEILYVDKKAFNEIPSRIVIFDSEEHSMR